MKIILDKKEKLKKQLANHLHEEVVVNCRIHGELKTTIGKFLDTGIVSDKIAKQMPAWHEDQLAHPLTKALMNMVRENHGNK
tara:strand:+ start:252 stop:497 length:246 start_codon:yes stop_codon:yes gene_type:complete